VGIRRPSILYYFPSKQHLYEAVENRAFTALVARVRSGVEAACGGHFSRVIALLDATLDFLVARPTLARIILRDSVARYSDEDEPVRHSGPMVELWERVVREGQAAVFVHEGQLADVFGPGLYMLETNNLPILTSLQHWDHGFESPFKSEIYFVNTTRFNDQKWGTRNPIMCRDPEFGPVRIRAFGTYSMRVADPGVFLREVVGTDGEFTSDEVSDQIRNVIVQEAARVLASSGIPVLDMAANTADLGKLILTAIAPKVAEYGLALPEFYIENISLPEEVEKAMDRRTSMGVVGDMNRYAQFQSAEAIREAAKKNPARHRTYEK